MIRLLLTAVTALTIGMAAASGALAQSARNVLFVLDSSGSMAQKMGAETKMAAAKRVFGDMLGQLPADTHAGLEVYGHYGDRDCSVIDVLVPIGPLDAQAIRAKVEALNPMHGATPLAASLERAAEVVRGIEGSKSIIVISDGEENCGGDPVAAAKGIRDELGIDVQIHVVGFGVNAEQRQQLESIAKDGGGNYYPARDAKELAKSLAAIKAEVIEKQPEPEPEPASAFFEDHFEGAALGSSWEVITPDSTSITVEDSHLWLVATPGAHHQGKEHNLVAYTGQMPDNYEVYTRFTTPVVNYPGSSNQTAWVGLTLFSDASNLLYVTVRGYCCGDRIMVEFSKMQNSEWAPLHGVKVLDGVDPEPRTYEVKIVKQAFKYTAYVMNEKDEWREIGTHAFLGKAMRPGLEVWRADNANETITAYDILRINTK